MAAVKLVAVSVALAAMVACVLAHSHMNTPRARGSDDGGNNHENPCGGFNATGTTVYDFDMSGGQALCTIGHGDVGPLVIRYWKRGDANGTVAQGIPDNARDPASWTQVGSLNVSANPPAGQTVVTNILAALPSAKVGDIGVLQMHMTSLGDGDEGFQCADIRLVRSAAAAAVAPSAVLAAAAALIGLVVAKF